jgi:Flp pilus assembly pilin Flp
LRAQRPIQRGMNRVQLIFAALKLSRAASRQEGQALIEYALIVSLVALIAIASLKLAGTNISSILNKIAGEV